MGQQLGVCMISIYYYPWAGGAEKQAERLGSWLVDHGVPVMMVTRRFDDSPTYEVRNGIHIYRIRTLPGKAFASLSFTLFATLTLLRHRKKFNVIHSHQVYSPTTIGWLAARLLRYPLIVNLHLGGAEGDIQRLLRNASTGKARLETLKRDASAFIAISQEIAQEMRDQDVPEAKIHFLVNAVDPNHFIPLNPEAKLAMRRKLNLPPDAPLVVFVARLVEIKGAEVLLKAWEQVPAPAHLVVIGTGALEDKLKAQAAEKLPGRVTFTGRIENVDEYLQAADAWTLPSFGEGLPVSLLEAMSVALPVVATPVGAIPEIIESGVNGLIVPTGDVDALAQALTTAISRTDNTITMGKRARDLVLQQYSLDAIGRSYLELYQATRL
ncbi:MAG: glycosyltransferase family 4 protein [Anaerolineae bacterium]|nr:glycosyltransferase family 4 protein [Anaerolineae bacterium]